MADSFSESGVYHYQLNGQPTAIEERWERRQQSPTQWLVNSSRVAPGVTIEVEARMVNGLVTQFQVVWRADEGPQLQAQYALQGDILSVVRRRGRALPERENIIVRDNQSVQLLSPLMRIYAGPVIARLLASGGAGTVILPLIGEAMAPERLLRPQISERLARVVAADVALELAGVSFGCQLCEYLGDQYTPGTQFWLAEDDLLVRYQWQQSPSQHWDVWLQRAV